MRTRTLLGAATLTALVATPLTATTADATNCIEIEDSCRKPVTAIATIEIEDTVKQAAERSIEIEDSVRSALHRSIEIEDSVRSAVR